MGQIVYSAELHFQDYSCQINAGSDPRRRIPLRVIVEASEEVVVVVTSQNTGEEVVGVDEGAER